MEKIVRLLQEAEESAEQTRNRINTIQSSEDDVKIKNEADQVLVLEQGFEHPLSLAIQKFERVRDPISIEAPEEAQVIEDGGLSNEEIDMYLRDIREDFKTDVTGSCRDIREGLASNEDAISFDFYNDERQTTGYQMLRTIREGLEGYI